MSSLQDPSYLIDNASRRVARCAWLLNCGFFAVGACVSTFVYVSGRVGDEVVRMNRTGQVSTESAASALFSLPFFQLILFMLPLLIDVRWEPFRRFVRSSHQFQISRDPKYQKLDPQFVYYGICFIFALCGCVALVLALSEAMSTYACSLSKVR